MCLSSADPIAVWALRLVVTRRVIWARGEARRLLREALDDPPCQPARGVGRAPAPRPGDEGVGLASRSRWPISASSVPSTKARIWSVERLTIIPP